MVLVNTCGFIDSAKKDSIDTLLAAADRREGGRGRLPGRAVRQRACRSLPEADAVLGFDTYADIAARLDDVRPAGAVPAHQPRRPPHVCCRSPRCTVRRRRRGRAARATAGGRPPAPATGCRRTGPTSSSPPAATGAARSAPSRPFAGSFVSRPPADLLAEARWLAATGVRELVLVSENSTSYGKDLGDLRALEKLLPQLAAIEGIERIRVSYLQPAELRPSLLEVIADTPGVAPYFDLSFQHASDRCCAG